MQTLEQELKARTFLHKVSIVGGALMRNYIISNSQGITLHPSIIEHEADQYSNKIIQNAISNGTFDELYNRVWEQLKDVIPDNLKLIQ